MQHITGVGQQANDRQQLHSRDRIRDNGISDAEPRTDADVAKVGCSGTRVSNPHDLLQSFQGGSEFMSSAVQLDGLYSLRSLNDAFVSKV